MTNPLQLINNNMSVLIMQSKNMFDSWHDASANKMQSECLTPIQREYKSYTDEMNVRLQIYMRAQEKVVEALREIQRISK